jgi:hypothetical protein
MPPRVVSKRLPTGCAASPRRAAPISSSVCPPAGVPMLAVDRLSRPRGRRAGKDSAAALPWTGATCTARRHGRTESGRHLRRRPGGAVRVGRSQLARTPTRSASARARRASRAVIAAAGARTRSRGLRDELGDVRASSAQALLGAISTASASRARGRRTPRVLPRRPRPTQDGSSLGPMSAPVCSTPRPGRGHRAAGRDRRLRGMPEDRRHVGAPAPVPDLRQDRPAATLAQPPRHGPLPRGGPPAGSARPSRRGLELVLLDEKAFVLRFD